MPILGIDASRAVKQEKTGVEWYSYFLLRAMEKMTPEGWSVRLYVPTPPPQSSPIRGEEVKQSPSPLVGEGWGEGQKGWEWKVLRWIGKGWTQGRLSLEMMKSPPDVLFVPSHVIPLIHPERTVTTVHDVVFARHPELYDPKDLEAQKRGLEFALKFAKKIIVPSKATREDVVRAGGRPEQIVVVPHGVEIAPTPPNLPSGRGGNEAISPPLGGGVRGGVEGQYILFIGRIERKKNVLGLIHAFRRLTERVGNELRIDTNITNYEFGIRNIRTHSPFGSLKLVLAGPLGYGGEDVLQAIRTFKLEDRVVQLGWVDGARYRALLQGASLLILPSFGEGFGLPILEAMAAGTPVVCSDLPVLREVGGNAAQYVNPRDPADIARGIQAVLKNEMLASEMVKRGKEKAAEYTWERSARETWDVIKGL